MNQRLSKTERLKHKKEIDLLFNRKDPENLSVLMYPIRAIFRKIKDDKDTTKVLFSVSKKKYNRAVDRNLMKRRMREAYRKQKSILEGKSISKIAFLYLGNELETQEKISVQINNILLKVK